MRSSSAFRDIATRLESDPNAETNIVVFPGWHTVTEEPAEELVREAAAAILAAGIALDEGIHVSQKAVAALIHYIADMIE